MLDSSWDDSCSKILPHILGMQWPVGEGWDVQRWVLRLALKWVLSLFNFSALNQCAKPMTDNHCSGVMKHISV